MADNWRAAIQTLTKNGLRYIRAHKATALLLAAMTLAIALVPVGRQLLAKEDASDEASQSTSQNAFRANAGVPVTGAPRQIAFHAATDTKDITETCWYTDEYFRLPATTYQPSLCTATLCLAMSAFASSDEVLRGQYANQAKNAIAFLGALGMQDVAVNPAFTEKPKESSIGVAIGHKTVQTGSGGSIPLIAVAVRGYNYESEWAANFDIGTNGNHKGFQEASDKVVAFIHEYVTQTAPALAGQTVKLWITGFSRAAATSNLTGAQIDDAIAGGGTNGLLNVNVGKDDLYVYTFETPAGSVNPNRNTTAYNNIFNIVNPHDLVPMVAPDALPGASTAGFGHYGVNLYLPSRETHVQYAALFSAMKARYDQKHDESSGYAPAYKLEEFIPYKITWHGSGFTIDPQPNGLRSRGIYYYDFVRDLTEQQLKTRENYIDSKLQQSIQNTVVFLMVKLSAVPTWKQILIAGTFIGLVVLQFSDILDLLGRGEYALLAERLKTCLVATLTVYGLGNLAADVGGVVDFLINIMKTDPNYIFSLLQNRDGLMQGHMPELCMSWLEMMDSNYSPAVNDTYYQQVMLCGEYRLIAMSGNATMTVRKVTTDSGGNKTYEPVATLSGDATSATSIVAGQNADAEMVAVLPVNAEYEITIRSDAAPGENALFSYAVSECNPLVCEREKRFVYYLWKPIDSTSAYTGAIPAFTEAQARAGIPYGSTYAYTLQNGAGDFIAPDGDFRRGDIEDEYKTIELSEINGYYGHAYGQGRQLVGTQALVTAIPTSNGVFVEWRNAAGEVLSKENAYKFQVTPDASNPIQLTAVFAKKPEEPIDADAGVPNTGDGTPVLPLLGVLLAAGVALAILRATRKRQKGEDTK